MAGERLQPVRRGDLTWHRPFRKSRSTSWLGVAIDPAANRAKATRISAQESRVPVFIIPTDEERMIARHTLGVIAAQQLSKAA